MCHLQSFKNTGFAFFSLIPVNSLCPTTLGPKEDMQAEMQLTTVAKENKQETHLHFEATHDAGVNLFTFTHLSLN